MKRFFIYCFLFINSLAVASEQPQVSINAWLDTQEAVVPNQQVKLYIEIATDRWFSKGSRFTAFDIANTIVLKRDNLAINGTKRLKGKTWSTQTWVYVLYPQKPGKVVIPNIKVQTTVAGENRASIINNLVTPALVLQVNAMPDKPDNKSLLVGSAMTIEQQFSQPIDSTLSVGDSLIQKVRLIVEDSTVMLLPPLLNRFTSPLGKGYLSPEQLTDKQNRGDYQAIREEQITWVIEKPGKLVLPATTIYWWDTQSKTLKIHNVEGGTWQVKHSITSFINMYWLMGAVISFAIALLVSFVFYCLRLYELKKRLNQLPSCLALLVALKERNSAQLTLLLYRKLSKKHQLIQLQSIPDTLINNAINTSSSPLTQWQANHQKWQGIYQTNKGTQQKKYPWKAAVSLWIKL